MSTATRGTASNYLQRAPSPSGLADVIDLILDKGLVIDAYVRIAVIGIELITIDARIVIASVDTYLRFAEAVNRLDLEESGPVDLRDLGNLRETGAKMVTEHKVDEAADKVTPSGSGLKKTAKSAAAAIAIGAAAAAAKELADRAGGDHSGSNGGGGSER
jgi:gas vesicle structural protein